MLKVRARDALNEARRTFVVVGKKKLIGRTRRNFPPPTKSPSPRLHRDNASAVKR